MFLPGKYKERAAYSPNLCLEDSIPLTLRKVDIVLIFYIGRRFESHALSTRVTLHPVSRQAVESGSESNGRYSGVRVMEVVAYVQPLNASPKPKDWCTVLEAMIGMDEAF